MTIEKIIQEKFDKFRLWFEEEVFWGGNCIFGKLQVHRMTSKWPWILQGQMYPTHVELLPASHKFHAVLLYDFFFRYSRHRLQLWIWFFFWFLTIFSKISKITNVVFWGALRGKFKTSWKLWAAICRRGSVLKLHAIWSHLNKKEKNRYNFNLKKKNPKRTFVRSIGTKIRENLGNFLLQL